MKFEELVNNRKKWVELSKLNNFDFNSILAGLYADLSHFVYELLQNAEDEEAKEVRFELFKDRLDFYHNGKNFDLQDIDGVTGIGISKKKEDLNFIGKFGVGFKSVFAVTQTPYIFSGEYKIRIDDFVVPTPIEDGNTSQALQTLIRLPFNHPFRSPEECFALIDKRLKNLGLKTLLFLKNIEEIKWQTSSSEGHYIKKTKDIEEIPNAKRITLISSRDTVEYLLIKKPIEIEGKKLWVEVAYCLGKDQDGKEIIIPETDSKLVVFFPTEKVSFLNFIIQGPFKTTPNRENIPLEDEQNKVILEEIGDLVAESLTIIKNLGYLDVNFLNILPLHLNLSNEQIYSVLYKKVKEKLLTEEFLPTSDGKYAKAVDVLLARGKELTEFLDSEDIQKLFNRRKWLNSNITYDKTRELRDYLINELEVPEIDFESFARKITEDFLQSKSDEWIIEFYRRLLNQQSLWSDRTYSKGILRTKPIIRLENDEHIAPYDESGKLQVYLPTDTPTKYKTVKRIFTENEESLKFLKELGLTKPDLFAEIREFILPKYKKENPKIDEQYFDDFKKLLIGYETIPSNKKNEFVKELSEVSFVYVVKNDYSERCLLKPSKVYFGTDILKQYFSGYPVYFVSEELFKKFEEDKVSKFLKELGVEDKPRRIEIEGNLSWDEKRELIGNHRHSRDISIIDYEYEGLEIFIKQISPEKSFLLWELLLKSIENLSDFNAKEYFKGKYYWFYYNERHATFDAKFLRTLKQCAWLVDKSDRLKKPIDITFSELSGKYIKESPNIEILKNVLEFKPEIVERLPENDRKIIEIVRKYNIPPEKLEKILSEVVPQAKSKEVTPWKECEPEDVPIIVENPKPAKIDPPDLSKQSKGLKEKIDRIPPTETKNPKPQEIGDKKAIGEWGEKYVYMALKEKYQKEGNIIETEDGFKVDTDNKNIEVIWLNKHNDRGKGYDFVIRENGEEIEYIEVKSKTAESPQLLEVGGIQWEWARKLFNEGKGNRYSFYVVLNTGKEKAVLHILKNPIKLWKEGKLYAHPVNFEL